MPGLKILASPEGSDTRDIIQALIVAVPAAVKQQKEKKYMFSGAGPETAARQICAFLQKNVKYSRDGYDTQAIQLPNELLRRGVGDCKSLALYLVSMLTALGYKAGFRFVAFRPGEFTHVYGFVKVNEKNIYFDPCIYATFEQQKFLRALNMEVVYLAGVPTVVNSGYYHPEIGRLFKKRPKGAPKVWKKIAAGPIRGAFLPLVNLNFRGLATRLKAGLAKNPEKIKKFWLNLGGDPNKLISNIESGAKKKRILGPDVLGAALYENGYLTPDGYLSGVGSLDDIPGADRHNDYIGIAVPALLSAAGSALIAVNSLLKSLGIGQGDKDAAALDDMAAATNPEMPGTDFVVTDPEPGVMPPNNAAARSSGLDLPTGAGTGKFELSPPIIMAAVGVAALLMFKSKK